MPSKAHAKNKSSLVFVPSKPWSANERGKKMPLAKGKIGVSARFFEQVYVERGHVARLGKKGRIAVSSRTLNRLISNPEIPKNIKSFLLDISKEKRIDLSKKSVLVKTDLLTKILNRKRFSPDEFSFLEDLRVGLIHYSLRKFGR